MSIQAVHVFYDTYMGWSHATLLEVMRENAKKRQLERGEIAIFLNKAWDAVKLLAPGNAILYHRDPKIVTIETIRYLPTTIGGQRLTFSKDLETKLIKAFEDKFGKQVKRLKVAHA